MNITKIYFRSDVSLKALAVCDVVLDNCLKLTGIRLYNKNNSYFLVFPSKQDLYREVESLNDGVSLVLPPSRKSENSKKQYEELFYPVDSKFYKDLLNEVVIGYSLLRSGNEHVYIPQDAD